jgi:L-ascorbate metabolism protein UlaG (beta-lactamase superfamily)
VRPEEIGFARDELRRGSEVPVVVRWLGTAGFAIEHAGWVLLIDPYLTRASIGACLSGPLAPDVAAIRRHVPAADAIVCGHTHFDHALDVPPIARFTGARVFGSRSAVALCRAGGVAEDRLFDVESPLSRGQCETTAEVGPFELRFVPSAHSPLLAGRVPFPGDIVDCDQVPARMQDYRCGAVFAVIVRVGGRTIYHAGSANVCDDALPSVREVDLLLLCVAGWHTTARLPERMLRATGPSAILLSHWDNFFAPLAGGARLLPAIRFQRLVDSLAAASRDTRIGTLPFLGEVWL